jgi:hypothetical protein
MWRNGEIGTCSGRENVKTYIRGIVVCGTTAAATLGSAVARIVRVVVHAARRGEYGFSFLGHLHAVLHVGSETHARFLVVLQGQLDVLGHL